MHISSGLFGAVAEYVGPRLLKVSKVADLNLQMCMPNLNAAQRKKVIAGMWNNLGRIFGELPHWSMISSAKFKKLVKVVDHSNGAVFSNPGSIIASAHYGNWELSPRVFSELQLAVQLVYRPANNPYVDALILKHRNLPNIGHIKKGVSGVRSILKSLLEKKYVGMLVDQKTNDGIEVEFFGRTTKTTPAPANLAIKYGINIYLCQFRRVKGINYQFEIYPLEIAPSETAAQIMQHINQHIMQWIEHAPEQWMWVHKRWDKRLYY